MIVGELVQCTGVEDLGREIGWLSVAVMFPFVGSAENGTLKETDCPWKISSRKRHPPAFTAPIRSPHRYGVTSLPSPASFGHLLPHLSLADEFSGWKAILRRCPACLVPLIPLPPPPWKEGLLQMPC